MKIPRAFLEEAMARCTPGAECAALLFGRGDVVEAWRWMRNVLNSPAAFRLDAEEMYKALAEAEGAGRELVAIFHTHPGPPDPSPLDVRYMAVWRVVWLIANVYTWETAAWILKSGVELVPVEYI